MAPDDAPNSGQITYWNETAGPSWVAMNDALDAEMRELGLAAMKALAPRTGERLIDIGCGCGATTLELARRVGPTGAVMGVDISVPMLEVARGRAAHLPQVSFQQADAQTHPLAAADAAFSRFGVMFFEDPVRAFANVRHALSGGGRMAFVCWRAAAQNPCMTAAMAAVGPLLSAPPLPRAWRPRSFRVCRRRAASRDPSGGWVQGHQSRAA
jgi:trans-aconitate methyltransferase